MTDLQKKIFEHSKFVFDENLENFYKDFGKISDERIVEVPWFASRLALYKPSTLLDIGFTFASHDYLEFLFYVRKKNIFIEGMDIIYPEKVSSRYPANLLDDVLSIPMHIQSITENKLVGRNFDAISMISVIEHIGYDKPNEGSEVKGAFNRNLKAEDVVLIRDNDIEYKVLDSCYNLLNDRGLVFISAPFGFGGSIICKDSLDLYAAFWEYEKESLNKIIKYPKFDVLEKLFYKQDKYGTWVEFKATEQLFKKNEFKASADGVCLLVLRKK